MLQHIAQINCNRVYYIVYTFAQNYSIINVKWHILLKMPLKSDFISTFLDALKSPNDLNYFSLRWSKLDYSRPVFILTLNTILHSSILGAFMPIFNELWKHSNFDHSMMKWSYFYVMVNLNLRLHEWCQDTVSSIS